MQGLCDCADSNGQTDRWGIYTTPILPPTEEVCPTSPPTEGVCLTALQTVCPTRLRYALRHELRRALVEGLCRMSDSQWLDHIIQEQCDQVRCRHASAFSLFCITHAYVNVQLIVAI